MNVETQRDRIAKFKTDEMLDAALDQLEDVGWRALHIRDVAARVGVSRQTIYNTFGSRSQLATAMVVRLCEKFLSGAEAAFTAGGDLYEQWVAAVSDAMVQGMANGAMRAMLASNADDRFLDLLTRGAEPIMLAARERLSAAVLRAHPHLDTELVQSVSESVARLVISNVVLPMHPIDEVAPRIAWMAVVTLTSPQPGTEAATEHLRVASAQAHRTAERRERSSA